MVLSHYIQETDGEILNSDGKVVGSHDGALFYTIGQRHGFTVHTSEDESSPWFVISKDIKRNTITVSHTQPKVSGNKIELSECNFEVENLEKEVHAQFRYRQKPFNARIDKTDSTHGILTVNETDIDTPSIGQSCVLYRNDKCLGGGIISKII